jgi:ubiquinone/menaquinone biosynthesis C-methylase UbiE
MAAKQWYDANADVYDENLHLTFDTFREDESAVRNRLVDKLDLREGSCVLELGAGSGRDSVLIAERLGPAGQLYLQDISLAILRKSFSKLAQYPVATEFHVGNACSLPFPDRVFDAVFHFGGLNTFSDIGGFFREVNRVAKIGAKIVVGDESMPVWLRNTEFGAILMNSNPLYRYDLPLQHLPVSCREVKAGVDHRWRVLCPRISGRRRRTIRRSRFRDPRDTGRKPPDPLPWCIGRRYRGSEIAGSTGFCQEWQEHASLARRRGQECCHARPRVRVGKRENERQTGD